MLFALQGSYATLPFAAGEFAPQIASVTIPAVGTETALGINTSLPGDPDADRPFADVMFMARPWGSTAVPYDQSNATNIDANGWPTCDFGCVCDFFEPTENLSGHYAVSFTGKSASWAPWGTYSWISGPSYDSGTNTTTGVFSWDSASFNPLQLSFGGTQQNSVAATNTGITNLKVMRPIAPGSSTSHSTTEIINRQYVAAVAPFDVIRTMNLTATNGNISESAWSDRKLVSYARQLAVVVGQAAMAWEYIVAHANATGKDAWINVPIAATDAYITNLANLFQFGSDGVNPYTSVQGSPVWPPLNPGLHVYIEYSNEVWNSDSSFTQTAWNNTQTAIDITNGVPLNFDGATGSGLPLRRVAQRIKDISDLWEAAIPGGFGTFYRPLLMWQYSYYTEALNYLNNYYNNADGTAHVVSPRPIADYIWGAGAAWYTEPSNLTPGTIDDIYASTIESVSYTAIEIFAPRAFGLRPFGYEGGFSTTNDNVTAVQEAGQVDARAYACAYATLWDYAALGAQGPCIFDLSDANYRVVPDVNTLTAPKYLAIADFQSAGGVDAVPLTYGSTIPTLAHPADISLGMSPGNYSQSAYPLTVDIALALETGDYQCVLYGQGSGTFQIMINGVLVPMVGTMSSGAGWSSPVPFTISVPGIYGFAIYNRTAGTLVVDAPGSGSPWVLQRTGPSGSATVTATQLVITQQPQPIVVTGGTFGLTVEARDGSGYLDTSFTGNVTVSLHTNPGAATLTGTLTVAAVAGVATFSGLGLGLAVASGYRIEASA